MGKWIERRRKSIQEERGEGVSACQCGVSVSTDSQTPCGPKGVGDFSPVVSVVSANENGKKSKVSTGVELEQTENENKIIRAAQEVLGARLLSGRGESNGCAQKQDRQPTKNIKSNANIKPKPKRKKTSEHPLQQKLPF